MTVTQTDFAVNTIAVQRRRVESNLHLFALAIMYAEPTSTVSISGQIPTAAASSTSSSTDSSLIPTGATNPVSNHAGLSAGEIAGISVGVAVAGFIIGFVAWFLFRRRKNRSQVHSEYPGMFGGTPSSHQVTATELESEDPLPWNEAVKGPWKIKTPN
ncbi:hypothetical protein F4810DRAFT_705702 [Camillea tinctor]|nr:hypothetical protein F4810DRAFT_705702 [Camillea tinctor]